MAIFNHETVTASAGTRFFDVIPSSNDGIPRIEHLIYECGSTSHTLTIMRPIGLTVTTAQSLSGTSTLTLATVTPGKTTALVDESLSANDFVVFVDETGKHWVDFIASISGSVITMTSALSADVSLGATVWALYEITRTTHTILTMPASKTTTIPRIISAGYAKHPDGIQDSRTGNGDVLVVTSDNATAQGWLTFCGGTWETADTNLIAG